MANGTGLRPTLPMSGSLVLTMSFLPGRWFGPDSKLASDLEAVPKRSELAGSAVGADSYLQVGATTLSAAIVLIAGSIITINNSNSQ